MYDIFFYQDRAGNEPVYEFMQSLKDDGSKDARINLNKMRDYIKALAENGTHLPSYYCKHLDGEIWELRPIGNRILFAAWVNSSFVLLHTFRKRTQKHPAER